MMTPRSPSASGSSACMRWAARRIMLNVPMRFTRMTRSKAVSECGPSRPTMRLAVPIPAQLTSTRATPFVASSVSRAQSRLPRPRRPQRAKLAPISVASAAPRSAFRSRMPTFAPFEASSLATPAPRPDAPPVIATEMPLMSMGFSSCAWWILASGLRVRWLPLIRLPAPSPRRGEDGWSRSLASTLAPSGRGPPTKRRRGEGEKPGHFSPSCWRPAHAPGCLTHRALRNARRGRP